MKFEKLFRKNIILRKIICKNIIFTKKFILITVKKIKKSSYSHEQDDSHM